MPPPETKAPENSQPQTAPPAVPAALPAAPSYSTDGSGPPQARLSNVSSGFNPAVAAAALQLGQLQQLQFRTQGQEQLDKESVQKAEVRRARRFAPLRCKVSLSNCISFLTSRTHLQMHLDATMSFSCWIAECCPIGNQQGGLVGANKNI